VGGVGRVAATPVPAALLAAALDAAVLAQCQAAHVEEGQATCGVYHVAMRARTAAHEDELARGQKVTAGPQRVLSHVTKARPKKPPVCASAVSLQDAVHAVDSGVRV